jgi:putative endonuclease
VDSREALGQQGEDVACRVLRRAGYEILARRYRTRHGEIDVVAREGDTLVFVEVKTRRGRRYGSGAEAVTGWKQRRITRMTEDYLLRARVGDCPCRFDVVAVDLEAGERVEVIRGAF